MLNETVPPLEHESLYSLCHRNALANGFDHIASMLFSDVVSESALYVQNCNYFEVKARWLDEMIELTNAIGVDVSDFIANKYNDILFSDRPNIRMASLTYSKYRCKFCPLCIKENFYHRLYWDITFLTICTKHKIFLIDTCQRCGEDILLSNFVRVQCVCDFKYSDSEVEEAGDELLAVNDIHQKFILGEMETTSIGNGLEIGSKAYFQLYFLCCRLIDNLPGRFKFLLGMGLEFEKVNYGTRNKKNRNVKMLTYVSVAAHALITNPDCILPEILDELEEINDINYDHFLAKSKILKSIIKTQYGAEMHEIYTNYVLRSNRQHIKFRRMIKPLTNEGADFIGMGEAMLILKTEYDTVLKLCEINVLRTSKTSNSKRTVTLVERQSVIEFQELKRNSFNQTEVCEYLGITFATINILIQKGVLQASLGPQKDGYGIWYFPREAIIEFKQTLISKAQNGNGNITNLISFKKAVFDLRHISVGAGDLVELIFSDKLEFQISEKDNTIRGIMFSEVEMNKIVMSHKNDRIDKIGYTIREAAKKLKVGVPRLNNWIQEGKLNITKIKNYRGFISKYISKTDLEEFLIE